MKRPGPVRRKSWLKRSTKPIARHAVIKVRPRRSRFPKRRNAAYRKWIGTLRCLITGKRPVQGCHVKSQGAGGDDVGNMVPLIKRLHGEQHLIGIKSFEAKYQLDLAAEAQKLGAIYATIQEKAA